jgi:hypothetical protein
VADIFQEVEEELRRDKATEWWRRNSLFVYGAAAAVVIAVAGYQGWRAYDLKLRSERADSYAEATRLIEAGNLDQAQAVLGALSQPGGSGYQLLAAFTQARLAAEAGDGETALAIWRDIGSEASDNPTVGHLASLFAVMHQMADGDAATLRGELQVLAGAEAPYRFTALELLASLALREGDSATAGEHLTKITDDPTAPSGSRSRAAELLASLPG